MVQQLIRGRSPFPRTYLTPLAIHKARDVRAIDVFWRCSFENADLADITRVRMTVSERGQGTNPVDGQICETDTIQSTPFPRNGNLTRGYVMYSRSLIS